MVFSFLQKILYDLFNTAEIYDLFNTAEKFRNI